MRYRRIAFGVVVVVGFVPALFGLPSRAADGAGPAKVEFTCDDGNLTLNGVALVLPCELKALTAVFGEPDRAPEGGLDVKRPVPIWDKLGIVCHFNDDRKVQDISFRLGESPYPPGGEFAPKGMFTGGLTVDGVKFEGVVTFKDFWEKRTPNGKKLMGGERIEYANGNSLTLSCKEPAKGPIWQLAVFVRTKP
jgi:hypothetical protein